MTANTVIISEGNTATISDTQVDVTNVGEQGVAGGSSILGKSVIGSTVSVNGSLLVYNSSTDQWGSTVVPTGLTISGGSF